MSSILEAFQSTQNFTITLASLGSSATTAQCSVAVDNSSSLYMDAICQVGVKLQTGSPANDKAVYIYAYGSVDGTNYTDTATGTDTNISLTDPTNLRLVCIIPCPTSGGLLWESSPFSIAQAFGGILPPKWGIVIRNYTGVLLSATEADHFYKYRGVYLTS